MTSPKVENAAPRQTTVTGATSLVAVPADPGPQPRRRAARRVLALALLVAGLGLGWGALSLSNAPPQIPVETLVSGPVERVLAVSGRTITDVQARMVPLVSGRVTEVLASEGDRVIEGDVLLRIDDSLQLSRIRQAMASLDAGILRMQQAEAERDRVLRLGEIVSPVARAEAERAVALATTEVARLEAALDQARLALEDHVIAAPIPGIVLERAVEPGDAVAPPDVVMRIADPRDLRVDVLIDEIHSGRIRVGQTTWIQLAGHDRTETGRVSHVDPEVDDLTGSLRVTLDFDAVPEARIGLTAIANILIDTTANAITVPRSALVGTEAGSAVLVLRDGRADLTPITFVDWPADRVEVTSGLEPGDRIVLDPSGVEDGQRVAAPD